MSDDIVLLKKGEVPKDALARLVARIHELTAEVVELRGNLTGARACWKIDSETSKRVVAGLRCDVDGLELEGAELRSELADRAEALDVALEWIESGRRNICHMPGPEFDEHPVGAPENSTLDLE
jgi:hypothetical protein